jgi:Ni,Fe-hydrogenase I large subunit
VVAPRFLPVPCGVCTTSHAIPSRSIARITH